MKMQNDTLSATMTELTDTVTDTKSGKGGKNSTPKDTMYASLSNSLKKKVNAIVESIKPEIISADMKAAAEIESEYSKAGAALRLLGDSVLLFALCYIVKMTDKGESLESALKKARRACKQAYGQSVKLDTGDKVVGANEAVKRVKNVIDGLGKDIVKLETLPPIPAWLKEHEGLERKDLAKAMRKSFSDWKRSFKEALVTARLELVEAHKRAQIEAVMQATGKTFEEAADLLNVTV